MEWYKIMVNISVIGGICSIIITITGCALTYSVLKSDKYIDKYIEETPLLKYIKVLSAGVIFTMIFQIARFILRFFE